MKKLFWIALAATLALVSCKKETGEVSAVEDPQTAETVQEAPVAVQFFTNMPQVIETKGLGPLDKWRADQDLYVYGIARTMATDGQPATATTAQPLDFSPETGIFIPNKLITFPDGFFTGAGEPANPSSAPAAVNVYRIDNATTQEPYFYDEDRRYEFFGYFVDDAADAPYLQKKHAEEDSLTVNGNKIPLPTTGDNDITLGVTINGSQDIMLAHADKDVDNENYGLNPNRLYSAYSARRGVKPNLRFEHQLSRFNVYVKSGSTDPAVTAGMTVSTIKVETLTKGTLTITNKNKEQGLTSTAETEDYLPIWNASGKRLADELADGDKYFFSPLATWPARTSPVGTIMVMPGQTQYKITVGVRQTGYSMDGGEVESTYLVDFGKILAPTEDPKTDHGTTDPDALDAKAMAGHAYDVNMVVYGLERIDITISMSEWLDAGSFVINPEDDEEIAVTPSLDGTTPAVSGNGTQALPYVIEVGESYNLNIACVPALETNQTVTYQSKNENVAMVNADGVITGVGAGTTRILINVSPTADRPEGGYAEVWVKINPQLVLGIEGGNAIEAVAGDADVDLADLLTVKDNVVPTPNNVAGATVTYVSDTPAVATVSAVGVLHFVAEGTAKITVNASKDDYDAADPLVINVTVSNVPNETMTITTTTDDVVKTCGDANFNLAELFAPTAENATSQVAISPAFSYAVKSGESVTVDAGVATIVKGGVTTITITGVLAGYDNGTKDVTVTVNKLASTITLSSASAQVTALSTTATVTVTGGEGTGDISVDVVSGGNGHIAAEYAAGTITITATGATATTDNCVVRVSKGATDTYEAVTEDIAVTVAKADQEFTLSADAVNVANGTPVEVTVSAETGEGAISVTVEGGNGHVNVDYDSVNHKVIITATDAVVTEDDCTVHVTKAGNDNFNVRVKDIAVTIANV